MFAKQLRGAIITLMLVTTIGGLIWLGLQKEPISSIKQQSLTSEQKRLIKETLLTGETEMHNQQILKMIGHDIRQAEVCWECREFQEWEAGSVYVVYPVVGHRVMQGEALYTLVIGQVGWHAGEPTKMYVKPKSAIYVHARDRIYRIGDKEVTTTDPLGKWQYGAVAHLSAETKVREDAIKALQKPILQTF